jgi:hypothetical protein
MNRRGFLSALGALATTTVLPTVPAIPLGRLYDPRILSLAMNAIYGKTLQTVYGGGRYEYYGAGSAALRLMNIRSAYPEVLR